MTHKWYAISLSICFMHMCRCGKDVAISLQSLDSSQPVVKEKLTKYGRASKIQKMYSLSWSHCMYQQEVSVHNPLDLGTFISRTTYSTYLVIGLYKHKPQLCKTDGLELYCYKVYFFYRGGCRVTESSTFWLRYCIPYTFRHSFIPSEL